MRLSTPLLLLLAVSAAFTGTAERIDVRSAPYNATGDARTDDTAAFQKALDAAHSAGGGVVFAPAGRYRIAGNLRVPPGVTLAGVARAPQAFLTAPPGTTLLATAGAGQPDGKPFLRLQGPNATLEGITVFYPEQAMQNPPTPYPWTIRGAGENVSILNVLLVNPYQAVDFATEQAARHYIQGLYGQPLYKGIQVDQCYDIGRIKQVHFWPFWTQDKKIVDYTTTHGTTFIFQRTDWEVVEDIFCWGYKTGVEFSAAKHSGMNGQMSNINLDNVDVGFDVGETQPWVVHVSNLNIANAGAGTRHIGILGRAGMKSGELAIRGASFWGEINQAVRWENGGTLSMADSRIQNWSRGKIAVELLQGRAILHDNSFRPLKNRVETALRIGPEVLGAIFHDNQLNGHSVKNEGGAHAQVTNNQP